MTRHTLVEDSTGPTSGKNSTVMRVLTVLDVIARADGPLNPTEMAERLGIAEASFHRLCSVLEEHGYLQPQLNGRGLQVGAQLNRLATGILSSMPFHAPCMRVPFSAVLDFLPQLQSASSELGQLPED